MESNKISFRVLVLIAGPKLADKASEVLERENVPVQYEWTAAGTAPSELIDVLGLGSPDKSVLASFMPKQFAEGMLRKLKRELKFGSVNTGIAFTLPLNGASNLLVHMLGSAVGSEIEDGTERKVVVNMPDIKYSLIAVMVNQGYSENVMEAAREAGAGGGTVIPSRNIANEKVKGFWGSGFQEEKDIVLIVSDSDSKLAIMQAIGDKCGMHSDAKGMIISLPIDSVIGF